MQRKKLQEPVFLLTEELVYFRFQLIFLFGFLIILETFISQIILALSYLSFLDYSE